MTGIQDAPDPFDGRNDSVTWKWSQNGEYLEQWHDTGTVPMLCPVCGHDLNDKMVEFVRAAAEEADPQDGGRS